MKLPHGIPSPDTFGRVFAALDPCEFEPSFLSGVHAVTGKLSGEVVAVDGKKLRRSHDKRLGKNAIHRGSAWATAQPLVLGQRKTDAPSNELTAIPELRHVLALEGCSVTVEALGCQTEIAETIVKQGADDGLAVKANQGKLHADLKDLLDGALEVQFREVPPAYERQVTKDQGRLEIREGWVITDQASLDFVRRPAAWKNLGSLIRLHTEVRRGRKRSQQTRYFIRSLRPTPQEMLAAIRGHGGIENGLHWILDLAFREDDSRVRKDHAAENFAVLRHIALNVLNRARNGKDSIQTMRLRAGWDESFLAQLLAQ